MASTIEYFSIYTSTTSYQLLLHSLKSSSFFIRLKYLSMRKNKADDRESDLLKRIPNHLKRAPPCPD